MNALDYLKNGALRDALRVATADVKAAPEDEGARTVLVALLCFLGEWERADNHLELLGTQNKDYIQGVALWRQLIRGELSRTEYYTAGNAPKCVGEITVDLQHVLLANIALRESDIPRAARELTEASALRSPRPGAANSVPFEEISDLDEFCGGVLESVTTTGEYLWVPFGAVSRIECKPVRTLRDTLWLPARIESNAGRTADIFLCNRYYGSHSSSDEKIVLGQATDWLSIGSDITQGRGLRILRVGDECKTVFELGTLGFSQEEEEAL